VNMAKILLVEDDKSLSEIYATRLRAENYEIVSAHDGEEALAIAIKERPNLIISDVMMPKISGFDMLDILRSTSETKDIKVIMMTALSSDDQRARGEALGANRYLVKSQVGIEDVVRTVHDVLGDGVPGAPVAPPSNFGPAANTPAPSAPAPTPAPMPTPPPSTPYGPEPAETPMPVPTTPEPTLPVTPTPAPAPVAPPAAPVETPTPAPAPEPTLPPVINIPAAPTPTPVTAPTPAPAPMTPPAAEPAAPAPFALPVPPSEASTPPPAVLPEPTAPFSSPRPGSQTLSDRVINPINPIETDKPIADIAAQMNQELNAAMPAAPPPAPPTPPVPPVVTPPAPGASL
jgi:CheY-like chemotaxis protein